MVLDIVMFTSETQITTAARAMPPAMREMTAVQMHRNFVSVSAIACISQGEIKWGARHARGGGLNYLQKVRFSGSFFYYALYITIIIV